MDGCDVSSQHASSALLSVPTIVRAYPRSRSRLPRTWSASGLTPPGTTVVDPSLDPHLFYDAPASASPRLFQSVPSEGIRSDVGKDPAFGASSSFLLSKHDFVADLSPDESTNRPLAGGDPRAPPSPEMGVVVSNGGTPRDEAARLGVERSPHVLNRTSVKNPVEVDFSGRSHARERIPVLDDVPTTDELPEEAELVSKTDRRAVGREPFDLPCLSGFRVAAASWHRFPTKEETVNVCGGVRYRLELSSCEWWASPHVQLKGLVGARSSVSGLHPLEEKLQAGTLRWPTR